MNVGDKVRMMRGTEEGIVTRIVDNKLIEIEIEDGFQIPVLKSEVVVVAAEETDFFEKREPAKKAEPEKPAQTTKTEAGIFLAFKPLNDRVMAAYLINNSGYSLPYALYEERKGAFSGIRTGVLSDKSYEKAGEYQTREFDRWPVFVLQAIRFSDLDRQDLLPPLQKRLSLKAGNFFRNKRMNAQLGAEAHTFRLDTEKTTAVSADALKQAIEDRQSPSVNYAPEEASSLVDLHAEKLGDTIAGLPQNQILREQLNKFEQALDAAIANGLAEVTFIHGVGNGTLRHAIHKHLSKRSDILNFKDARKEKFGYGATLVRLK